MDKVLLIMIIGTNPQIIKPMDSAADCLAAATVAQTVYDKMRWCGIRGGCNGSGLQVTCWNSKENKAIEIPVDAK